jgi:hypothetical protein
VGRGVSASCIAVLSAAALLAGCGGGAPNKASSGTTGARSSSSAASSAPSRTTPPPGVATAPPDAYWPYAKLIARLAGRTVAVSNAAVRLDPALMECNGEGAARRAGSTREWSRYICTQTIFEGGADHDITFDVVISSATQMTISSPRTGPD